LLILFFVGVLYAAFPRYFAAYFRFTDWIHWKIKEEVLLKNAFAFPNLLVIFLLSLITACFSFYNGLLNQSQDSFFESQENLQRFLPAIGFVLSKTLLGFGLFVSRYFFINYLPTCSDFLTLRMHITLNPFRQTFSFYRFVWFVESIFCLHGTYVCG